MPPASKGIEWGMGSSDDSASLYVWILGAKTEVGRIERLYDGTYEWSVCLGWLAGEQVQCCEYAGSMEKAKKQLLTAVSNAGLEIHRATGGTP